MKKILTYTLAIVMCFTTMVTPLSATGNEDVTSALPIEVLVSDGFDEIFGNASFPKPSSINAPNNAANISYDFSLDENDPLKGYVSATVNFTINGKSCYSIASGEVEAIELTNDKYWQGFLEGNLTVGTDIYEHIYMHFTKLESKKEIRMSLSISTENGTTAMTFGNLLLDEQTNAQIQNYVNYSDSQGCSNIPNQVDIYQPIPNSNFYIINNAFSNFNITDYGYYSQRARACYDPIYHRLAISLKTYANDLNYYYMSNSGDFSNATYITGVEHASINLSRSSYSDPTYIDGIQNPHLFYNLFDAPLIIYDVFYDALNALGVPTNTIEALLTRSTGKFTKTEYVDSCSISIQSADNDYFNFDIDSGVPIIYQLDSSNFYGNGSYRYETCVTYKTLYIYPVFDPSTNTYNYIRTKFRSEQPKIWNTATFAY